MPVLRPARAQAGAQARARRAGRRRAAQGAPAQDAQALAAAPVRDRGDRARHAGRWPRSCSSACRWPSRWRWPAGLTFAEVGGIVVPLDDEPWRYVTASFVHDSLTYQFAALVAVGVFGTLLERRFGWFAPILVFVAAGAAGMAAAVQLDLGPLGESNALYAALGANGAALGLLTAWLVDDRRAARRGDQRGNDLVGVAVIAVLLLLLPLAVTEANPVAGSWGPRPAPCWRRCWACCRGAHDRPPVHQRGAGRRDPAPDRARAPARRRGDRHGPRARAAADPGRGPARRGLVRRGPRRQRAHRRGPRRPRRTASPRCARCWPRRTGSACSWASPWAGSWRASWSWIATARLAASFRRAEEKHRGHPLPGPVLLRVQRR